MSFLKRHWLYASVGLVVFLCVVLGAFLVWHANQPVELKTVYALPDPNPERAEILKRALQPPKRPYPTKVLNKAATTKGTAVENLDDSSGESSSQENGFEEENLESVLAELDEETHEVNSDFPPVPADFPSSSTPVWLGIPGYKKGDKPEHELISRVLIKLWNQGERGFTDGIFSHNTGKVYPLYPDVVYVDLDEDGTITGSAWGSNTPFNANDFTTGVWEINNPEIKFVEFDNAGYDPYTFLTDDD